MRAWLVIGALATAVDARADGIVEEVAAGGAPATGASPASRWLSDRVVGIWDASESLQFRLDLSGTRAVVGATSQPGEVLAATLSGEYDFTSQWSLRVSAGGSPASTTYADTPIADAMAAVAELRATSASTSAGASLSYDSGGTGHHALAASMSASATYFTSQQEIAQVMDPTGQMLSAQQVRAGCAAHGCSPELAAALWPQWAQLGQFTLGASATDTIDQDTDLGVDVSYYLYDNDPRRLGYFALATIGRGTLGNATGVAPLEVGMAPSVSHRWGALAATASLSYAGYLDDAGYDLGASLRVQYKLKGDAYRVKMYGKLGGAWHVDAEHDLAAAASAALGVQCTW